MPDAVSEKRGGIGNLRPPIKKGEKRNPLGINGATKRRQTFTAVGLDVMGRPVETTQGTLAGDEAVWLAMRNKALKGDVAAATWIRDTLYGKPQQAVELTGAGGAPVAITFGCAGPAANCEGAQD